MANLYGYKTKLITSYETTYGTPLNSYTGANVHADTTIDIVDNSELVDRMVRSGQLGETVCESTDGRLGGQVTISGVLTAEKNWLFKAIGLNPTLVSDTTVVGDTQGSIYSFTIARATEATCDVAYGCVATSFELSNDDNFINYSITFDSAEVKFGQTLASVFGSSTAPEAKCETPYKTKDFEYSGAGFSPLTFSLSITNELDEDKVNYGISNKKVRAIVSKTTGEFTIEGLLDTTARTPDVVGTDVKHSLAVGDGTATNTMTFTGRISSVGIPDVERGAYVQTQTSRIVKEDGVSFFINVFDDGVA